MSDEVPTGRWSPIPTHDDRICGEEPPDIFDCHRSDVSLSGTEPSSLPYKFPATSTSRDPYLLPPSLEPFVLPGREGPTRWADPGSRRWSGFTPRVLRY